MNNEFTYRTAKYLLKLMLNENSITSEQAVDAQIQLLELLDPPLRSIEEVGSVEEDRENTGN